MKKTHERTTERVESLLFVTSWGEFHNHVSKPLGFNGYLFKYPG